MQERGQEVGGHLRLILRVWAGHEAKIVANRVAKPSREQPSKAP